MAFSCQNIFQCFAQNIIIIIIIRLTNNTIEQQNSLPQISCRTLFDSNLKLLSLFMVIVCGKSDKNEPQYFYHTPWISIWMWIENVQCSYMSVWFFLVWLLFILYFAIRMLFTLHSSGNAWIQFDSIHIHILTSLKMITHHNHHNNFPPMTTIYTYSTLPTPSLMLFLHNDCFHDENWCTCIIYDEFWIGKKTQDKFLPQMTWILLVNLEKKNPFQ